LTSAARGRVAHGRVARLACAWLVAAFCTQGAASVPAKIGGASSLVGGELPPQTMVYFNARIALREERYQDVLRLWLLRNALESNGEAPMHDADFRSVVWVALAGAGFCQDGFLEDEDPGGAGLWPLALHNYLVRSSSKQQAYPQPSPFDSFETGFQQRFVSLHDVLSVEELEGVRFFRGGCLLPYLSLARLPTLHWLDIRDRLSTGIMMRDLIMLAQRTLKDDHVETKVLLETRLFDLDLALAKLAKAKARQETGIMGQLAKATGVSESAMTLVREARLSEVRQAEHTELLRRSLKWDEASWFSLSRDRRLALFAQAADARGDAPAIHADYRRTLLQNVDALIEKKDGRELTAWLGFAGVASREGADGEPEGADSELLAALTEGERGERLLSLELETGFRERGAVALRRGTAFLERGETLDAMRSFARALQTSEESVRAAEVHNLGKRWLVYVLSQYETDEQVLAILREFAAPVDRNELLEVLLWRAAFGADLASFERIAEHVQRRGSLDSRVQRLRSLAAGDAGAMWAALRDELAEKPHGIYAFVKRVTAALALEPLDVRLRNRATLMLANELLLEVAKDANRGLDRRIAEQQQRIQTLLDAIDSFDESAQGRVAAAAPGYESYAGSVRLAPADPLPWPFSAPLVDPPSPFAPIRLTPVEWYDDDRERVFGWRVHE